MKKEESSYKKEETQEEFELKTCGSCKHYIPHYIKSGDEFKRSAFGHCTYPQIKSRSMDKLACVYYSAIEQ